MFTSLTYAILRVRLTSGVTVTVPDLIRETVTDPDLIRVTVTVPDLIRVTITVPVILESQLLFQSC